jgi:hypothetical protein
MRLSWEEKEGIPDFIPGIAVDPGSGSCLRSILVFALSITVVRPEEKIPDDFCFMTLACFYLWLSPESLDS